MPTGDRLYRLPMRTIPLLLGLILGTAQADELLQQAEQQIQQGEYQQAYQQLDQHGEARAGEPEFDYLLGVAALRAGHPAEAMFALDRAVRVQPGHAAARMELVNAYLQLGMNHQAQQQLAILETQQPLAAARATMDRYQDILRPRLSGTPDPVRLLAFSLGYDDNVGSYPEMDVFGLFSIEPVSSSYAQLRGTWWQPVRLDDRQRIDLTLYGQHRAYQDDNAEQFDLSLLHTAARYNYTINPRSLAAAGIQANKIWLDGDGFRDHFGLNTRWEQRLGPDTRGELGLEWLDYSFDNQRNNYRQYNLHGRVNHVIQPALRLSALVGYELEDAQRDRLGGDADRLRLQGDLNWRFNARNIFGLGLSWSDTDYDKAYAAYSLHNTTGNARKRNDTTTEVTARWRHFPVRKWELSTELTYRDQDSTVESYNVKRRTAQLSVLRNF